MKWNWEQTALGIQYDIDWEWDTIGFVEPYVIFYDIPKVHKNDNDVAWCCKSIALMIHHLFRVLYIRFSE